METYTREQFKAIFSTDIQSVLLEIIDKMHDPKKAQDYAYLQKLKPPENGLRRKFYLSMDNPSCDDGKMHLGILMNYWINDGGHLVGRLEELSIYKNRTEMLFEESKTRGMSNEPSILN